MYGAKFKNISMHKLPNIVKQYNKTCKGTI